MVVINWDRLVKFELLLLFKDIYVRYWLVCK